jgi:hypothetical protein
MALRDSLKKKSKPKKRREEEDELEDDDLEEDDLDDIDDEPRPKKKAAKKVRRVVDEDEEDDDDIEDDDEEEERPKKKKAKPAPVKKKKRPVDEDDEDLEEDDEDVEDDEDDEDDEPPRKKKSFLGKKRRSVDEDEEDDEEAEDDEDERPRKSKKSFYYTDPSKVPASKADRFTFTKDEEAEIMFAQSDGFFYPRHYLGMGKGKGYETCPGEDCPLCEAGDRPGKAGAFHIFTVSKSGKLVPSVIIEGARFVTAFMRHKERKGGSLVGLVYAITKSGDKKDTNFDFEYREKRPLDKAEKRLAANPKTDIMKLISPKSTKALRVIARTIGDKEED